ncbi:MAG: hypothetical protein MUC68_16595 [Burkholderiaceae bacterium]|nr:hypothetical protein [Burkholderiaceae bacterium]
MRARRLATLPRTARAVALPALLALPLWLSVTGCGGGSDSAPVAQPSPAPLAPSVPGQVQITAANQDAVARASANVVVSAAVSGAVAPLADDDRVVAAARRAPSAPLLAGVTTAGGLLPRLAQFALERSVVRATVAGALDGPVRALATLRQTEACGVGGNVTITLNDADDSGSLSAGDSAAFSFNACRNGGGETLDGSLSLTVGTVAGANLSGTLTFTELATATLDASFAINGSVALAYTEAGTLATYQTLVGSGGLAMRVTADGFSDSLTLRAGFEQVATSDRAALPPNAASPTPLPRGLNTARVNGTLSANSLGGAVTLATPTAFARYAVDPYPRAGQLLVTGAGGSRLQITALSTDIVRIELDANGDGSFEQSRELPWRALI